MVDNEYSTDNYKSLKISIATMIKNLEMLRFVSDHFKTKKFLKLKLKKTQEMRDRVFL